MPPRKKLFISYRRKRWNDAGRLYDMLSKLLDVEIFMDFKGIDQDDFETAILTHLAVSDVVVVVVTDLTFAPDLIRRDDDWIRREIREALWLKKPIVLACIDGLFPPNDLPEDIRPVRNKEGKRLFAEYFEAGCQQLADLIKVIGKIPVIGFGNATIEPFIANGAGIVGQDRRDNIESLIEAEDYAQAVFELEALIDSGFKSTRFWDANEILQETIRLRDAQSQRDQMLADYAEIIRLDRIAKLPALKKKAILAWQQFLADYPDFTDTDDHANLRTKLIAAPPKSTPIAPPKPVITAEQQRLLDIMLDWQRYDPPKRAEAGRQLAQIGDPRSGVGLRSDGLPDITWCEILSGSAKLGGDQDAYFSFSAQTIDLPTFHIAKYPVTHLQFQAFLDADDGFSNDLWWHGFVDRRTEAGDQAFKYANHPRENVNWYDAIAFCRWLSSKLGYDITLPTEQQWEKAARGTDGRFFPWGNKYETGYANINETKDGNEVGIYYLQITSAVGIYPQGQSLYQVSDLSGNVWEWTLSNPNWYETPEAESWESPITRGGSWRDSCKFARAAWRNRGLLKILDDRSNETGFRVVTNLHPPSS